MTFWTHKNVIKEEKDKTKKKSMNFYNNNIIDLLNYNYETEEIIYYAVKIY